MTKVRMDGLVLVFLGATIVLLLMVFLLRAGSTGAVEDFISDYYSTRCLMQHCDPYNENEVLRVYRAEGGERPLTDAGDRAIATRYVYPPTAFAVMAPFALLPWGPAHILWMILSACSLIMASCLAWDLAADHAPIIAGALIGFLLANSEVSVVLSNPSELVISLCVIAVWCFLRGRYVWVGVVCLAVSLALKPQDPGLVWLYLLLAGGVLRRRALQALLVAAAIAVSTIVWVWSVAPHWIGELRGNLQAFAIRGGLNDPGPASKLAHDLVDLQVVVSHFKDDPHFYNLVSYLIVAPLLIGWMYVTLRTRTSAAKISLALAAIAALSLLPIHHHLYDTKLLLLTIPALALLWVRGGGIARLALLLTGATLFVTGDVSSLILLRLELNLHPAPGGLAEWLVNGMMVFPAPLLLLASGAFYLWAYWRERFDDLAV
jgi:hypothetical protein